MSLEEKLAAIREMAKTRQPPEVRAVMHQATEDLRASGIMDRVVKVGAIAPDFTLPDVAGQPVSLAALRARGPVVLSFYRGRW
jgi:AhpC/TSA family protein